MRRQGASCRALNHRAASSREAQHATADCAARKRQPANMRPLGWPPLGWAPVGGPLCGSSGGLHVCPRSLRGAPALAAPPWPSCGGNAAPNPHVAPARSRVCRAMCPIASGLPTMRQRRRTRLQWVSLPKHEIRGLLFRTSSRNVFANMCLKTLLLVWLAGKTHDTARTLSSAPRLYLASLHEKRWAERSC